MKTMHMLHPLEIAKGDIGTTVRLGFKWADVRVSEMVELCVCTKEPETHDVQGHGKVESLWVGRFRDIPAWLISFEHLRSAREYWGLYDSMLNAYGKEFGESSFVTVVMYRRVM